MIKETVETRWFFETPPLTSELMFGKSVPPIERTDWYAFPCYKYNGVKFREGRLETKLLVRDCGAQSWQHMSGIAESWTKWTAQYDGEGPSEEVLRSTGWVAVHKRRHWQALTMHDGKLEWSESHIDHGCEVEWSVVSVDDKQWWTIGFEAVGRPDMLIDNLRCAIEHVLVGKTVTAPFRAANSMGYPAWLWTVKTGDDMPRYHV